MIATDGENPLHVNTTERERERERERDHVREEERYEGRKETWQATLITE